MASEEFDASVMEVLIVNDGTLLISLRGDKTEKKNRWFLVPAATPGFSTFVAVALSCLTSGIGARAIVEDMTEFSNFVRLMIRRPG